MRAFTCTVLFAISSVAYASDAGTNPNPDGNAGNEHAEEGNDPGATEDPNDGPADVEDPNDPHSEEETTDPGVGGDDFEDEPDAPAEDPIPELEEDPVDEGGDDIPDLSDEEPDTAIEWGGESRLVAVVGGERLEGWESLGIRRDIPVAVYALEDDSMLGDVGSVFVTWEGSFSSFGPSLEGGDGLLAIGDEIQVIVTSEAYVGGIADMMGLDEAPESAFIVDRRYLAADVDGEYGAVLGEWDSDGIESERTWVPGWNVANVQHPAVEFLVGYPDQNSATGVYMAWQPVEGGMFLDLGVGWEDSAMWTRNAPEYAFDGEGPIDQAPHQEPEPEQEPEQDDPAPHETEPDRDERDRHERDRRDPHQDDDSNEDVGQPEPELDLRDPMLGDFPGM